MRAKATMRVNAMKVSQGNKLRKSYHREKALTRIFNQTVSHGRTDVRKDGQTYEKENGRTDRVVRTRL